MFPQESRPRKNPVLPNPIIINLFPSFTGEEDDQGREVRDFWCLLGLLAFLIEEVRLHGHESEDGPQEASAVAAYGRPVHCAEKGYSGEDD